MLLPAEDAERRLAAARAGSREAMGEMLEACRAYLLLVAERELDPGLRAKGGASDLVQQTFVEAQQGFARFRGETEAELLAWLRQALLNNVASFARTYRGTAKRRLEREVGAEADGAGPADSLTPSRAAVDEEKARAVAAAIAALPDDYRHVIVLRYTDQLPFEEIARQMGRSANAVRKLWARAVERLQLELGELK